MSKFVVTVAVFLCTLNWVKAKDSIAVHLFLLDDCVICQDLTPVMNELYEQYGQDYPFIGYFPNFSSKQAGITAFKEKYGITFPVKTDYYKTHSSKFGATVTPEVVVYNHSTEETIYKGRINNKFYKLGRRRHVVTRHELADVLAALAANKQPHTQNMEAIGCYINYSDAISKHTISN